MKTKIKKQTRKMLRLKIIEHYGSQVQFAYATGIQESTISKIIRCVKDPTKKQIKSLPKLLKTPENQLFIKSDAN